MPIIKSAKKALRQSESRKKRNRVQKDHVRAAIKKLEKAVSESKNKDTSLFLSAAYQAIDKASKNNVLPKNRAARMKSRLAHVISQVQT